MKYFLRQGGFNGPKADVWCAQQRVMIDIRQNLDAPVAPPGGYLKRAVQRSRMIAITVEAKDGDAGVKGVHFLPNIIGVDDLPERRGEGSP